MKGLAVPAGLLAAAMLIALWFAGEVASVGYIAVYAVAVLPGLPVGIALFGRRHPAAWVGGALIGYGLTQVAIWFSIETGLTSAFGFAATWAVILVGTMGVWRASGDEPAIVMPAWTRGDMRALLLVLLLVPALMGPPYTNLGRADAEGNRYYRAYFTADFLWHSALGFELAKYSLPPRNPYLSPRPMNYYWTYFLLPSAAAETVSGPTPDVLVLHRFLKANAMLAGLLMIGALFLVVRTAVPAAGPAAVAVVLAVVAASAEGTYAVVDLLARGRPLAGLEDLNIDAITAWQFNGLRIDGVPRSLWYTPQHTTSVALGLVGWLVAISAGAHASAGAILGAGLALGLATAMNPLLGACFSIVYGIANIVDSLSRPQWWRLLMRHSLAAVPVLLAVAWGTLSRMTEGAGSAVTVGFTAASTTAAVATIVLSFGLILFPALAGLRRLDFARLPVVVAVSAIALGLFLLFFVRISEASWVGFRAGQILLISIPILLARALWLLGPRWGALLAAAVLVIGAPTTIVDTWNAQDIGNRRQGPGFRWTIWTTAAQERAFAWLRTHTPSDAVVQMEPMVRAREHWTLIPSFAGRRMAAGLPISLLPMPEYTEASTRVQRMFATSDVREAQSIARSLRLDYVYMDAADTNAYPDGTRKFDADANMFELVFESDDVRIYRVQ